MHILIFSFQSCNTFSRHTQIWYYNTSLVLQCISIFPFDGKDIIKLHAKSPHIRFNVHKLPMLTCGSNFCAGSNNTTDHRWFGSMHKTKMILCWINGSKDDKNVGKSCWKCWQWRAGWIPHSIFVPKPAVNFLTSVSIGLTTLWALISWWIHCIFVHCVID